MKHLYIFCKHLLNSTKLLKGDQGTQGDLWWQESEGIAFIHPVLVSRRLHVTPPRPPASPHPAIMLPWCCHNLWRHEPLC